MSDTAACGCGNCASCASRGSSAAWPGRRGVVPSDRTHEALRTRLTQAIERVDELAPLSADAQADPTHALLDAWAASLHVLSFYVERTLGDCYIETADDPTAVDALARAVGYQPVPALSATTTLAFTVDEMQGAPPEVRIPRGAKVQSEPRPGETPVVFETAEALQARPAWNAVAAKRLADPVLILADRHLRIAEMQIAARPGDVLVALRTRAGGFDFAQARIDRVDPRPPPAEQHPHQLISFDGTWRGTMPPAGGAWPDDRRVVVLSRRAALFGYNAPTFRLLSEDVRRVVIKDYLTDTQTQAPTPQEISAALGTRREWPKLRPYVGDATPTNEIDLDAVYPEAFRGRHVLLTPGSGTAELYRITDVREVSRTEHGITSRVSRLTLDRNLSSGFGTDAAVRSTSVLIETEQVTPAKVSIADPAPSDQAPDRIALATACTLPAERVVIVRGRGRRAGTGDALAPLAEVARVARLEDAGQTLVLTGALANRYDPQTLEVLGNAVGASHGETRMLPAPGATTGEVQPEILGGGDARRPHPAYALRQPGLTHLPAPTATGYAPAIEVRVDGVERPRVDSLYGRDEDDRGYAVELGPDRPARVRFAARLRSGADNVTAVYRVGGGTAGVLDPDRLKLPLTIAAGLRGVTNPVAATGGKDAEGMESARVNAPVRIVTLDRIVSLGDYAAFARAYGGISQAEAALVWDGRRQVVVVTIAGPDGAAVPTGSDLYKGLAAAMKAASAPGRAFRLFDYVAMPFGATLALAVAPGHRREVVESAVRSALRAGFGAAARRFGEPVARSRLLACAQAVEGVRAARVDGLSDRTGATVAGEVLGADEATGQHGAGLLLLDPAALVLTEFVA